MLHKLLYFCCSVFLFNFFVLFFFCYFCSCFFFFTCCYFSFQLTVLVVSSQASLPPVKQVVASLKHNFHLTTVFIKIFSSVERVSEFCLVVDQQECDLVF